MLKNELYEKRVYESDSSDNEVQNKEPHTRTMKSWCHKQTFELETEANALIEEEACWSKQKNMKYRPVAINYSDATDSLQEEFNVRQQSIYFTTQTTFK